MYLYICTHKVTAACSCAFLPAGVTVTQLRTPPCAEERRLNTFHIKILYPPRWQVCSHECERLLFFKALSRNRKPDFIVFFPSDLTRLSMAAFSGWSTRHASSLRACVVCHYMKAAARRQAARCGDECGARECMQPLYVLWFDNLWRADAVGVSPGMLRRFLLPECRRATRGCAPNFCWERRSRFHFYAF